MGHPTLRKVAEPVGQDAIGSEALHLLIADMVDTLHDYGGIGLAAPQVGVLDRLIVLDCVKEEGAPPRPRVLINPVVTAASDETSVYEEVCLSIPEQYADVTRPAEVEVRWLDRGE